MSDIFTEIKKQTFPRNKFDMSFDNKLTTEFGRLTPMLCKELMPGDDVKHEHEIFVQFMPLNAQMMHRFYVRTEYFFVPHRLVYEQFNAFLTGGPDGTDIIEPPYLTAEQIATVQGFNDSSLGDYLGLPGSGSSSGIPNPGRAINSMPFRSYQLIYNEWYRDENTIEEVEFSRLGGQENTQDVAELLKVRQRAWRKDYFAAALPWPQKGPTVVVPIADVAYVYPAIINNPDEFSPDGNLEITRVGFEGAPLSGNSTYYAQNTGTGKAEVKFDDSDEGRWNKLISSIGYNRYLNVDVKDANGAVSQGIRNGLLFADLRQATALSIEELRRAFAVQEWLELNAIGGTRDVEMIYTHFGVRVPDYRLGRPEYIAGYSQDCTIGNVYSTVNNDDQAGTAQAVPVSNVQANGQSNSFRYYAHEHGYLIGIVSIMPRASYFQGLPRMFGRRQDKFDYYWPKFAQLGFQPIYQDEIYMDRNENEVFGYTPRYSEFKFSTDEIHGAFRSSLNDYHAARIFQGPPNLNQQFLEVNSQNDSLNRIFNYTASDEDHILIDIYHHLSKVSAMVYFGIPKIM